MTTKKLDSTGLQQVWAKIVANFGTKELQNQIKAKLDTVAENAQVNVIESIKVNGTALEVTEKGVNIVVPEGTLAGLDEVGLAQLNAELKNLISGKANAADVYTKSETDAAITTAVNAAVAGVYKVKGSVAFASLPAENVAEGDVYNVTDEFTTTDAFVEGAGKSYPAGTNVVAVDVSGAMKWDCMAGTYDFSEFVLKSDIVDITQEEIDAICVMPA